MESELIALYSTHHKHELVFPRFPLPHFKAIAQILSPLSKPGLSTADRQKRLADLMHYLQKLGSDYKELIFDCSDMFYKESRSLVLDLFAGYDHREKKYDLYRITPTGQYYVVSFLRSNA